MLQGDATVELVNFGVDFNAGYTFGREFVIPPLPVLTARLQFTLGAELAFDAGYDLLGASLMTQSLDFSSEAALQQSVDANLHRLADGFFFDDHIGAEAPDTLQDGDRGTATVSSDIGPDDSDHPELTLSGKITAGVSVGGDIFIAEFDAGVNVFFDTSVFFDLNDLPKPQNAAQADYVHDLLEGNPTQVPTAPYTYDGRVRVGELELVAHADPFGVFNTSGALSAGLEAFVNASVGLGPFKVTLIDETDTLVSVNVFDFDIHQLADAEVLAGQVINAPTLGKVSAGTLTLFMGDTGEASGAHRQNTAPHRAGNEDVLGGVITDEGYSISSRGPTDPANPDGGESLLVKFLVREGGAWSSAGLVSLRVDAASPFVVGGTVTFTTSDSHPHDMADPAGLVAGDFSLRYDPSVLGFLGLAYPGWITAGGSIFAVDNGAVPPDGEVLVTIAGFDAAAVPATPDDLFSVTFVVRQGGPSEVSVAPALGDPPGPPAYAFDRAVLPFAANAVPLPSTLALVSLGLLAAFAARRRCPA